MNPTANTKKLITSLVPAYDHLIHSDYQILRKEGRILVHATDEIMVAGAKVTIRDGQGKPLEVEDASQVKKDWWEYVPQAEGRVSVSVWDLLGNQVSRKLEE